MIDDKHNVRKVAQDVFLIWKELGETPLQALERLRESQNISKDTPMTYAGRLDPLAQGELLILVGQECKKKDKYLGLDKEYEVEILLGPNTDTGDVMGIITESKTSKPCLDVDSVEDLLKNFIGTVRWEYPAFSSKTVKGKHLFLWSLDGRINEINIPIRESEIYELVLLDIKDITNSNLKDLVHTKINSIKLVSKDVESKRLGADFRRDKVLQSWANFFNKSTDTSFVHSNISLKIIKVRCKCSSGTYMRTLAKKIGEELNTSALALSIVRTKILM